MPRKVGFKWEKGNLPLLIIRATCGTLGIFCNYYAIDHLVLADANILNKMSPFFAIIFSLILLKERASVFQYAAVGGIRQQHADYQAGFFLGNIPGNYRSAGWHGCRRGLHLCARTQPERRKSARIVFFFSMFSTLVCVPSMIMDYHPMTWGQFFCLIGAGASAALGQFGVTLAYANAPAKEISVFDYTQVIFSAVLGFFLFGQLPDGWSVLGYLLICGISVAVFFYNRNLERKGQ